MGGRLERASTRPVRGGGVVMSADVTQDADARAWRSEAKKEATRAGIEGWVGFESGGGVSMRSKSGRGLLPKSFEK